MSQINYRHWRERSTMVTAIEGCVRCQAIVLRLCRAYISVYRLWSLRFFFFFLWLNWGRKIFYIGLYYTWWKRNVMKINSVWRRTKSVFGWRKYASQHHHLTGGIESRMLKSQIKLRTMKGEIKNWKHQNYNFKKDGKWFSLVEIRFELHLKKENAQRKKSNLTRQYMLCNLRIYIMMYFRRRVYFYF